MWRQNVQSRDPLLEKLLQQPYQPSQLARLLPASEDVLPSDRQLTHVQTVQTQQPILTQLERSASLLMFLGGAYYDREWSRRRVLAGMIVCLDRLYQSVAQGYDSNAYSMFVCLLYVFAFMPDLSKIQPSKVAGNDSNAANQLKLMDQAELCLRPNFELTSKGFLTGNLTHTALVFFARPL